MSKQAASEDAHVGGVRITHPDRVLFPKMGATKADVARYFETVAPLMLPHLDGRLISLLRCPEGRDDDCFFQKHPGGSLPDGFATIAITEKSGKKDDYLLVPNKDALIGCAQVGALELHLWAARKDEIEKPDRLVFDLDPAPGVGFDEVKKTAYELRDLLEKAGLASFAMLTGGKGIHVVSPIERRQGWNRFAGFAKAVAKQMEAKDPDRFVATMSKEKRKGRIFIDYLRNQRGSTAITPFSPRAREGAPVAVPVTWKGLGNVDAPNGFTLSDVAAIKAQGDAWKAYSASGNRLTEKGAKAIGIELEPDD